MRRFGVVLLALAMVACGPSAEDMKELRSNQKQILAKLRDMERKLEKAGSARPARGRNQPDPNKVYNIPVGKSAVKGPAAAPVTIVEFSDFQCPFCARSEPLIESVLKAYPKEVKLVYKNFPLTSIHPYAMGAAKAAVAAGKQGKFWEMHDILFKNQRALGVDKLKEYAQQIGLNVEQWEKDMKAAEIEAIVRDEMKVAGQAEVRGTPTFFVNGKRVTSRSEGGFKSMIEAALKGKKAG